MEEGRSHVLVVAYPAQGHIIPPLQFAERLASKGVKVTFATSRYTIQSIEVKNMIIESISNGYDDGGFKLAPSAEDCVKSFQEAGLRTLSELVVRFKDSVKAMFGKWPLKLVGPVVPSAYLDQHIRDDTTYEASLWEMTADQCSRWLDRNLPNRVIYVSFGIMGNILQNQVEELAQGLIASDRPFLWVLKDFERKLSSQVLAIGQKALLVEWCNQLEVLDHPSTGCFIMHCEWNSTLEALSLGVPMVGMPLWCDQPTNALFLDVVWKVGARAQICERGFVMTHEIQACINRVMSGEQSEELVWELAKSAVGKGGRSDRNIEKNRGEYRECGG